MKAREEWPFSQRCYCLETQRSLSPEKVNNGMEKKNAECSAGQTAWQGMQIEKSSGSLAVRSGDPAGFFPVCMLFLGKGAESKI